MMYKLAEFRKKLREAFNRVEEGQTIYVERYGVSFQIVKQDKEKKVEPSIPAEEKTIVYVSQEDWEKWGNLKKSSDIVSGMMKSGEIQEVKVGSTSFPAGEEKSEPKNKKKVKLCKEHLIELELCKFMKHKGKPADGKGSDANR